MKKRSQLITAGIVGATAVILGAFGAHALKDQISQQSLDVYKTGIQYQFYHAIIMTTLALSGNSFHTKSIDKAFLFFFLGIILFSGSLYLLSIQVLLGIDLKWLGPITPLGGLFFILGWIYIIITGLKLKA